MGAGGLAGRFGTRAWASLDFDLHLSQRYILSQLAMDLKACDEWSSKRQSLNSCRCFPIEEEDGTTA